MSDEGDIEELKVAVNQWRQSRWERILGGKDTCLKVNKLLCRCIFQKNMLFIAAKGLYPLNLDDALTPSGMTKNIYTYKK